MSGPLLEVRGLVRHFPGARRHEPLLRAVDGVDLDLAEGEVLGLVGESGCGKSTTARLLMRLDEPTAGTVRLRGVSVLDAPPTALRAMRREMQIVFQDPLASLDPRWSVAGIVGEPLAVHRRHLEGALASRAGRRARVREVLDAVGLGPETDERYPHELSGGQRQRVAIARALVLRPRILLLDEPVSALDVSVQAQVLNLLQDLRSELGLSYLMISHDLAVVNHVASRVAVMYLGRIVECAPAEALHRAPRHPYTEALLSAAPVPDPVRERARERIVLRGEPPDPRRPPAGCRFHPRCPRAQDVCAERDPVAGPPPGEPQRRVACHFPVGV